MNTRPKRQRNKPGDRERQQRLRDRRKADGWRRVSVWLPPEQAERLETLGGNDWLGRTVKQLLSDALQERQRRPAQAAPKVSDTRPAPVPVLLDTRPATHPDNAKGRARFLSLGDKAALMAELDSLLAQGLSGGDIARKFNAEGRRTIRGAAFTGRNLIRDWRKWKGE